MAPRAFALTRSGALDQSMLQAVLQRSRSAMSNVPSGTTFLALRRDGQLHHLVIVPNGPRGANAAFQFAQSVSARSDETDLPDLSSTRSIARVDYDVHSVPGAATQAGGDVRVVAQAMATTLRDDEWVAITVRKPYAWTERRFHQRWMHSRAQTHHSLDPAAVVATVTAGAGDFDSAENAARQAVLAMPGWDYPVRVRGENGRRAAAVLSSLGALAGVAGWAASTVPFLATAALPAAVLAALFFAIALGAAVGVVPIAGAYRARRIRRTRFPAPLLRVGLVPRAPHGSHQMVAQDGTVARVPEHGGDYPVSRTAFVIGPLQAIALAAPHAGAASGAGQSKLRVAPPALRERVGPMLGVSDGEAVYLSERDRYSGCFMSGGPGSGKTLFLLTLWGYDAFNRARCSGPAGGNAMIWFDTKMDGEAATAAARLSKFGGDKFVVIRVGDPTSQYGIEMLPRVGSAAQRGRDLAAIFKSVFGEQAIAFQSQMTLQRVFTAGFAISECPALVAQVPGLEPGRSPIWYADVLLSNRGSHMAVALFQALQQAAINGGYGADVEEAFQVLQPMFELSEAKRIDLSSAPRSKTDSLMLAEHWWSRPVRIPWEQILTQKAAVVIDFGGLRPEEGETGAEDAQAVLNTELRDALAAMMLHTLRVEIERVCAGWFRTSKRCRSTRMRSSTSLARTRTRSPGSATTLVRSGCARRSRRSSLSSSSTVSGRRCWGSGRSARSRRATRASPATWRPSSSWTAPTGRRRTLRCWAVSRRR